MRLRPEYKDQHVCVLCGAPAMLLGEPWKRMDAGVEVDDFYAVPIEIKCDPRHPGAVTRSREVQNGRQKQTETYTVRVFTHVCTRDPGFDAHGQRTDDPQFSYACGALPASLSRKGDLRPFKQCFDDFFGGEEQ